MARFNNFSIWYGRLPHWRADGVTYYATFKHTRELLDDEMNDIQAALMKQEGKQWTVLALLVLPERTEILFESLKDEDFSKVLEKTKRKAGDKIIKRSGERYPPFYFETYDRIVRDQDEFSERLDEFIKAPYQLGLVEEDEKWPFFVLDENRV